MPIPLTAPATLSLEEARLNFERLSLQALQTSDLPAFAGSGLLWNPTTKKFETVYAIPSQTINAGDAAAAGAANSAIRSDAQFAVATGAAASISGQNQEGSSTNLARAD